MATCSATSLSPNRSRSGSGSGARTSRPRDGDGGLLPAALTRPRRGLATRCGDDARPERSLAILRKDTAEAYDRALAALHKDTREAWAEMLEDQTEDPEATDDDSDHGAIDEPSTPTRRACAAFSRTTSCRGI
jgi:hypothetical protein